MAEQAECPVCGEEMDKRGLAGHIRMKHGDREADAPVRADESGGELTEDVAEAYPVKEEDGAVVFRDEIRVTDQEAKQQLVEALKEKIRGRDTLEI